MRLEKNKILSFDPAVSILVAFTAESHYEFKGVKTIEKLEDGVISIEKTDGNFVEIRPPFMFIEIGAIKDNE